MPYTVRSEGQGRPHAEATRSREGRPRAGLSPSSAVLTRRPAQYQAHTRVEPQTGASSSPQSRSQIEADARTRTGDPFITSEVLYQLSYVGEPPTLAAYRAFDLRRSGRWRTIDARMC